MVFLRLIRNGLLCVFLFNFCPDFANAAKFTDPTLDPHFLTLASGINLKDIQIRGRGLSLTRGTGNLFSANQQTSFEKLMQDSKSQADHPVQWVLTNLDNNQVIDQSANPDKIIFGASVSKVFVASTLVDHQGGILQASQWQPFADMLVVSSNTAWVDLQKQLGGGYANQGRERIQNFTQRMGYLRTKGFQGNLGPIHGNELNAKDLVSFLYDTYHANYTGAETVWKMMHTVRTGANRGFKYIPRHIYVAGKTGTYDGPTINPETGEPTNADGSTYKVRVRHHLMVIHSKGQQYGLAILANTGSDESAALLAGGLFRQL